MVDANTYDPQIGPKHWCRDPKGPQRGPWSLAGDLLSQLPPGTGRIPGAHRADLARERRTGEGFIHPPTSFIQQTNLKPFGDAALGLPQDRNEQKEEFMLSLE